MIFLPFFGEICPSICYIYLLSFRNKNHPLFSYNTKHSPYLFFKNLQVFTPVWEVSTTKYIPY